MLSLNQNNSNNFLEHHVKEYHKKQIHPETPVHINHPKSCDYCGNVFLLPTGTCFVCPVCGSTAGCG